MNDSRCAFCKAKYRSELRIYFEKFFVSLCLECYDTIYTESEKARVKKIRSFFWGADKKRLFQSRSY